MSQVEITNNTELHAYIMKLNYRKEEQEMELKQNIREVAFSIHPSIVLKNVANRLLDNHEGKGDLKSIGVSVAKDFLISKMFGRGSLRGFLTSLVVKKATDYLVNKNPDLIDKGFEKLKNIFKEKEVTADP